MKISDIHKRKNKTLSFEIYPPKKDRELENIDATLSVLCELEPDYISVTFGAGGSAASDRTLELAKKIKNEYGIEPVVHLTCLNYNREEILRFADKLQDEGIENILALRGDVNPDIAPSGEFGHSSDLISFLKDKYDFCFLGACYPECHPESENMIDEIKHLKTKVDAGAEVLLSQLFFDNETFYKYSERCRIAGLDVPVVPGVMPVINSSQIRRMVGICGASVPERFKRIIDRYEDNKEALFDAGLSYAITQIIDLLVNDTHGVHLYTMNNPKVARRICEGIKNIV